MVSRVTVAHADQPTLAFVDGWPINIPTLEDAVERIAAAAGDGQGFAVATLNLDHLVKLRRDALFRKAYSAARFITADGAPVARIARRQSARVERTAGADLLIPLCEEAARRSLPVYIFGSDDGTLAEAARTLSESMDGRLDICGTLAPSHRFDPCGPEADAAIDRIARSGARLCFVALGAPKQEIFAARAVERGVKAGFVCIGAAVDFVAGRQVRAPRLLREHGLEWLWRLSLSPARMASRYAQSALLLLDLTVLEPLRGFRGETRQP